MAVKNLTAKCVNYFKAVVRVFNKLCLKIIIKLET